VPAIGRSTGKLLVKVKDSSTTQTENIKHWAIGRSTGKLLVKVKDSSTSQTEHIKHWELQRVNECQNFQDG
jgi:hypothetical protein